MNPGQSISPHHRLPSIDGWRAISITLVLIQHSSVHQGWPQSLSNPAVAAVGGVGVRFFFVISGFLITWLMLREISKTGTVSLVAFYVRRSLRILPAYFVYVFCVWLVAYFGPLTVSNEQWIKSLTFTANYGGVLPPLAHLWTLAIEEQFYLIWPFVVAFFCRGNARRLIPCLLAPIILCPIFRSLIGHFEFSNPILKALFLGHSFLALCDGLAIGCLSAVLFVKSSEKIELVASKNRWFLLFLGCGMVVFPLMFWMVKSLKPLQPLQDTIQCAGFALLLLQSIYLHNWFPFRILNVKYVASIGVISYSLYMWHGLFDISPSLWPPGFAPPHGFPNWLVGVVVASLISYFLIEKPSLALKGRVLSLLPGSKAGKA